MQSILSFSPPFSRPLHRRLLAALAAAAALPGVGAELVAQCGTTVSLPVFNATWTPQGSPYCVTGNVQISSLTIQPGVEVRIAPGASLSVVTWLRALGTREHPIVFTAQNAAAGRWGGIQFHGPVPPGWTSELRHCVVTGADNSGVRILDNDQVTLVGCRIHDNTSPLDGGGVSVVLTGGNASMFDCDIENNRAARHGGGVSAVTSNGAVLAMTACRVHGNLANANSIQGAFLGGGIRCDGNMDLTGCSVIANAVNTFGCSAQPARGGGIHVATGGAVLANSVVMANRCAVSGCNGAAEGGGIHATSSVPLLQLTNCLVGTNVVTSNGGGTTISGAGVYTAAVTTTLTNCTIARNSFDGLRIAAGTANVTNGIVYHNGGTNLAGAATVSYCAVQGGYAGTGNIPFDPAFTGPGTLPEHYNLFPISPCIDAGDPAAGSNDGCRPPAQGGPRNDIGALGGPGNCDFGGPSIVTCGAQVYGSLQQGDDAMTLDWTFTQPLPPFPGVLACGNGPANSPAFLLLGFQTANTPVGGVHLLVDPGTASLVPLMLGPSGAFAIGLDLQLPFLVGAPVLLQAVALPSSGDNVASNGLRIATCW